MQELLFGHYTDRFDDDFGDYKLISVSTGVGHIAWVCLFRQQWGNGKYLWAVGNREKEGDAYRLYAVKEFKHSKERALRVFADRSGSDYDELLRSTDA